MATHKIHIPDKQHKWQIKFADKVKFIFDEDVTSFEIVDHRDYFDPKSPSGSFAKGDKIGPYTPVVKDQNVNFKYAPDNCAGTSAGTAKLAEAHTILIGN